MHQAYIVDAVRSAVGKKNGSLSATRADELCASVVRQLVERTGAPADAIEDMVLGCVTQIGEQGWNVARLITLIAGLPVETCGTTVNRMCGSSLQTTNFAAQALMSGQQDLVISAGVECMSRTPMMSDGGDISTQLTDKYQIVMQGTSAEMIAAKWGLTREQLDDYSWESHQRAVAAQNKGWFDNEIVPIETTDPEGNAITFNKDETPRGETPREKLGTLRTVFQEDGVITAGNASQICDGAAALLMASEKAVEEHGLKPRARVVSTGLAGVDPTFMLNGNPQAINAALDRAGLTIADMGVIEVNEAFASVPLQTAIDLKITDRMDDLNPLGGGISLGHPLGASGARILATMLNEMDRRDTRYGIASMCIGFGMAVATVVERV